MRIPGSALAFVFALAPAALWAALPEGAKAPDFTTTGALAGKPFRLHLKEQLRHGPIVLYFYPKAFTQGCTLEAHAFSEAAPEFRKLGAQVIGMSADDQPTLARFSTEHCRNAFPVATATPETVRAYDVSLKAHPPLTDRTSYVIAPDGRILYVYSDLDYSKHVENTLKAVRDWKAHKG
jgi:thioredoxin-dependent peroxiredoxin